VDSLATILEDCKVTRVTNSKAAGATNVDSDSILDMKGYDAVAFVALFGTVTDGSVLSVEAKGNTTSSTSGATSLGKTADHTGATSSNKVVVLDVIRPAFRYVYPTVNRATQNAVIDGVFAIQYRSRNRPVTQVGLAASKLIGPGV